MLANLLRYKMLHAPRLYVYLDAVARAGSIRKAAEKLHVASTALNRQILQAEGDLGTPLFERLPRGVRLTAAGEVLLSFIRRSLNDLEYAVSQIEQLRGMIRGVVRLACAESVGTDIIPKVMAEYQAMHPGVQFHLRVGSTQSLFAAVLSDEVELMIAHDPPQTPQLTTMGSVAQPLFVMMCPGHPLSGRKSLRLAECQPYPIALGDETFGSRRLIDQHVAKFRLQFRTTVESSSMETMKSFVRHGEALCFQFEAGTRRDVNLGELIAIPLSDPELARGRLVLAIRSGRTLPIAALTFMETLRNTLFNT